MDSENTRKRIMIVAGEDSGDRHAAALIEQLLRRESEIEFFGAAGPKMREKGVESIVDSDDFGIVGVPEVLRAVPMFLGVMKRLLDEADKRRPDTVVLVDFPEFNLKFAKKLKKAGHRVIYYISPQLWAWRKYRIRGIRKYVDLLLTILPFEQEWYSEKGVDHVEFIGHPLIGEVEAAVDRSAFRRANEIPETNSLVALLPGSRRKEIQKNLPVMLELVNRMKDEKISFAVAVAESRSFDEYKKLIRGAEIENDVVRLVKSATYDLLNAADAAVVSSGTATLETLLIGTPQVIVYRSSALNYVLLRPLISIDTFGLANLVAGEKLFTELIQNEFNVGNLETEVRKLLEPANNRELRSRATQIKFGFGDKKASAKAAEAVIDFIKR